MAALVALMTLTATAGHRRIEHFRTYELIPGQTWSRVVELGWMGRTNDTFIVEWSDTADFHDSWFYVPIRPQTNGPIVRTFLAYPPQTFYRLLRFPWIEDEQ